MVGQQKLVEPLDQVEAKRVLVAQAVESKARSAAAMASLTSAGEASAALPTGSPVQGTDAVIRLCRPPLADHTAMYSWLREYCHVELSWTAASRMIRGTSDPRKVDQHAKHVCD